jgi:CheY-like chemotaxis protein
MVEAGCRPPLPEFPEGIHMNSRVLCVDDDPRMLAIVKNLDGYPIDQYTQFHVETEQDAEQALAAVANRGPYAVILPEMEMPGMNGIEFLRWVR